MTFGSGMNPAGPTFALRSSTTLSNLTFGSGMTVVSGVTFCEAYTAWSAPGAGILYPLNGRELLRAGPVLRVKAAGHCYIIMYKNNANMLAPDAAGWPLMRQNQRYDCGAHHNLLVCW